MPKKGKRKNTVVPFQDPWYSPLYYKKTHLEFRDRLRQWIKKNMPEHKVHKWDEEGGYPTDLPRRMYEAGFYAVYYPEEYGGTPPPDYDHFHVLILFDELARTGGGGLIASLFSHGISLPVCLEVGSKHIKDLVARDVIEGKKIMSLAITEPTGGSDVANLKTTAIKEGNDYIINGEKVYITSGIKADYYVVACRTGKKGFMGVSTILVPKTAEGLHVSRMKTMGWWSSNTAYLVFRNVRVPRKNLIGMENMGFMAIMLNFNQERFGMLVQTNRFARECCVEAVKFARQRKTFGKRLIDHQAIRHKIAEMARQVEATHTWIEQIALRSKIGGEKARTDRSLFRDIALLKVQCTKTFEFCARESAQIFGGRSYVRGGRGGKVERMYREVRVMAIAGGSEEIMLDLAMKQAKL